MTNATKVTDGNHRNRLEVGRTSAHALSRRSILTAATAIALSTGFGIPAKAQDAVELLNVSYDPTREFYREYNALFNEWWTAQGHPAVTIQQSHGGSGGQARAVIDGLEAQVVTLALSADIAAIAENTGKIPADWQARLPHNSSPYTSTIVFLVREGNPKGIKDWGDLIKDDVQVITPNPKTSGGARWNFLAAWGWALKANGDDEAKAREYVSTLFKHVPVLDTGARGATNTFAQRGIGDVLLAWENEAFLALAEQGEDAFDIVVPTVSILAEPPVALVDENIKSDEQRAAAEAYLEHLYSPEAQALALKNYYRAWDSSAGAEEDIARFPELDLLTIEQFGGWAEVQPAFFGDGGIFDQIYEE
ncbi:MAG: sulfate ABC transporter substrate-binding protein [Paracoccus denitrificans]|uniref:Sulfate ABC transporter substrate-binding protein n=1 Tax=Paracoccus denitrificans TaxID=266 RepID=A0A533IEV1_PARDE|nr:MAG: sulfate ABC transporter substrate-binding protein [Paracoccus denitrificans]